MTEIGNRILKLRNEQKLTQQQLADKVGVVVSMISKIETGLSDGSIKTLSAIAQALDVSASYILTGDKGIIERRSGEERRDGDRRIEPRRACNGN